MNHLSRLFLLGTFLMVLSTPILQAQFFTEDFSSYADGVTSGTAGAWTSSCPACVSGDHFEVRSGSFEANDVNDFATWESQSINIGGCSNVTFSLDAIENGDHEGPGCACGVNIDYFDVYYSIDGGPFTVIENWNNDGETGHTLTGDTQMGVFTDADWGSTNVNLAGLSGNTLALRVIMRNTSGTEFLVLDNVVVDCLLPVALAYFHAEAHQGAVELKWAASAPEIDFYTVQRSVNGMDFESLGTVAGSGAAESTYSFTDIAPLNGEAFYRLQAVDQNGQVDYSDVFHLDGAGHSLQVSAPVPNPAHSTLAFALQSSISQTAAFSLTDLTGKQVYRQSLDLEEGVRQVVLGVDHLPRGLYFLTVQGKEHQQQFRVVLH